MGRITENLLRRRAEHNDGQLASLRELSLEGQSIERIELIAQRCPRLEILHLQNNIIARIEGLHRLKVAPNAAALPLPGCGLPRGRPSRPSRSCSQDLQELNLAINNLTRVDNLHRCESLHSLDLTLNFIASSALPSLASLADNCHLRQLTLLGNPCCGWHGYRNYVVSLLPQLAKLVGLICGPPLTGSCRSRRHALTRRGTPPTQDGQPILPSERIAASQQLHCLIKELEDEGAQDPPAEVAEVPPPHRCGPTWLSSEMPPCQHQVYICRRGKYSKAPARTPVGPGARRRGSWRTGEGGAPARRAQQ